MKKLIILSFCLLLLSACSLEDECYNSKTEAIQAYCYKTTNDETDCVVKLSSIQDYSFTKCEK